MSEEIRFYIDPTPHNSVRLFVRFPKKEVPEYPARLLNEICLWGGFDQREDQEDGSLMLSWEFNNVQAPFMRYFMDRRTIIDKWQEAAPLTVWTD